MPKIKPLRTLEFAVLLCIFVFVLCILFFRASGLLWKICRRSL